MDGMLVDPSDKEPWWHPLWVPWAESADGNVQVIDLREGPGFGRLGWAGHTESGDFSDGWTSLGAYLSEVARALDEDGNVRGRSPFVSSDGQLRWEFRA
jgi:cell wall assembly regulator SMI1